MTKKKRSFGRRGLIIVLVVAIVVGVIYTQMNTWSNTQKNNKEQTEDQIRYDAIKSECDAAYQSQVDRGVRPVRYPCDDADIRAFFLQRYSRNPVL